MSDLVVPDVTEPIVACRAWRYRSPRANPNPKPSAKDVPWRLRRGITKQRREPPRSQWRLESSNMGVVWPTRDFEARHENDTFTWGMSAITWHEHYAAYLEARHGDAPSKHCSCGVWALADPELLFARFPCRYHTIVSSNTHVYGVVHLWGRVIPGDDGWRAQHARIAGFMPRTWLDRETRAIARQYGVPILRCWPELTDPKEVASWTSDASTR